jgi:hypothetical protein
MMDKTIQFFNTNSGGIQAFSAILMFIATLTYVIINSLMHREIVKERKRYEDPDINLRFRKIKSEGYYNLIVENISDVSAKNIKFLEYPALSLFSDMNTSSIGFIKNGINFMGPKQKYESFFLDSNELNKNDLKFKIKYENTQGDEFIKNITFNSASFKHIYNLGKPFEEAAIDELKGIKNKFN